MKKAILKFFSFFILMIIIDQIIFIGMAKGVAWFRPADYTQAKGAPQSDIIIMGTSHAGEGFDTAVISEELSMSTYNFGRARRNIDFCYYLSRFLIQNKEKPKKVIIGVSYHDFNEHSRPYMILPFLQSSEEFWQEVLLMSKESSYVPGRYFFLADRYSADYRMLCSRLIGYAKNRKREAPFRFTSDNGFNARNTHIEKDKLGDPDDYKLFPFKTNELRENRLKELISLWKESGVEVYLIDPPEYIGTRKSRVEYDQFKKIMNNIAKEMSVKFKTFNTLDYKMMNDYTLFKDGGWGYPNSHLNRKGAAIFSKDFSAWLKLN